MTADTTSRRRPRRAAWLFNLEPLDLELTIEEVMADLDPDWLVWADQPPEETNHERPGSNTHQAA